MFSGHTVLWSILSCAYVQYCKSRTDKIIGVLGTVIGVFVLLACKAHYSIGNLVIQSILTISDIAVGAYVGDTSWIIYHYYIKNATTESTRNMNKLVWYFEEPLLSARDWGRLPSTIDGIIPNETE